MNYKANYVRQQGQTRDHHCHWPGCTKQVPPAMWGCKQHWFKLPQRLRNAVWRTYQPGQEVDMTPSEDYLRVADEVQRWIHEHLSANAVASADQPPKADGSAASSCSASEAGEKEHG